MKTCHQHVTLKIEILRANLHYFHGISHTRLAWYQENNNVTFHFEPIDNLDACVVVRGDITIDILVQNQEASPRCS